MQYRLKVFVQLSILLLIVACTNRTPSLNESQIIYIFNPSDAPVTVKIDGQNVDIQPERNHPKQLLFGQHYLEYGAIADSFYVDSTTRLYINPLMDTLIAEEIVYIPNSQKDTELTEDNFKLQFITLEIDSQLYYGPFQLRNDVFIYDGSYGPNHPVNLQLTEHSHVKADLDNIFSVIKYYSKKEFIRDQTPIELTEE